MHYTASHLFLYPDSREYGCREEDRGKKYALTIPPPPEEFQKNFPGMHSTVPVPGREPDHKP
jgi:hypothetical protein